MLKLHGTGIGQGREELVSRMNNVHQMWLGQFQRTLTHVIPIGIYVYSGSEQVFFFFYSCIRPGSLLFSSGQFRNAGCPDWKWLDLDCFTLFRDLAMVGKKKKEARKKKKKKKRKALQRTRNGGEAINYQTWKLGRAKPTNAARKPVSQPASQQVYTNRWPRFFNWYSLERETSCEPAIAAAAATAAATAAAAAGFVLDLDLMSANWFIIPPTS